jgi:acetylornithine/succinyldiaminopimelate/putrescine aminotransferase
MDLFYVLLNYHDFEANSRIYAETPWTLESEVKIIAAEAEQASSLMINNTVYAFFSEIALIHKLSSLYQTQNLCMQDSAQRMIEFALKLSNHTSTDQPSQ